MPGCNGIKHFAYQQFSGVGQAATSDSRGKKSISYTLLAPVYRQLRGESKVKTIHHGGTETQRRLQPQITLNTQIFICPSLSDPVMEACAIWTSNEPDQGGEGLPLPMSAIQRQAPSL
jgi:hypothetical protein